MLLTAPKPFGEGGCGRQRGLKQKPAAVSSRGFLLNFKSTSASGVANYDDQNDDL
jgi:hypothetical protein